MNRNSKRFLWLTIAVTVIFGGFIMVTLIGVVAPKVYAAAEAPPPQNDEATARLAVSDHARGMAFLSASIVTCVSCVAAGIAVGMTGSAAIGAVAERPEILGRTILIVGLAEGIAIYGVLIAVMILFKV